ncbi:MAG: hypothetical protein V1899_02360 [Planctomycetota bacterium]
MKQIYRSWMKNQLSQFIIRNSSFIIHPSSFIIHPSFFIAVCLTLWLAIVSHGNAAEEKIRGILEKTVKPSACAQITDALSEIYYIVKTDASEKLITDYVGKNIKIVIIGAVETKEGDPAYFFNLKSLEKYEPKLPPAPSPATTAETATETKPKNDAKLTDTKSIPEVKKN